MQSSEFWSQKDLVSEFSNTEHFDKSLKVHINFRPNTMNPSFFIFFFGGDD